MNARAEGWIGSDFLVNLGTDIITDVVDVVVDLTDGGELLGIEILGLMERHPDLKVADAQGGVTVSFDKKADAIYIRIGTGGSISQPNRQAIVALDSDSVLRSVRVLMEE